jgi:hypothetical protein
MSALHDMLIAWIDTRIENMLAAPRAWGSNEAIEMQVLLLLEMRALVLNPRELATPRRVFDAYATYLSKTYPTMPHRPLFQIVETDHLGHALAEELRRAVNVLTRTAMEEGSPLSERFSDFVGYDEFCAARKGDITALRNLARRYRYETFVLVIKGKPERCRNLSFDAKNMVYRFADQYTRHPMRVELRYVERLVAIESGPDHGGALLDKKYLRLVA